MHDLYIIKIYRRGAVFLPLRMWVGPIPSFAYTVISEKGEAVHHGRSRSFKPFSRSSMLVAIESPYAPSFKTSIATAYMHLYLPVFRI